MPLEDQLVILIGVAAIGYALHQLARRNRRLRTGINLLRGAPEGADPAACPQCVVVVPAGASFCPSCQTPLTMGSVTAPLQTTFAEGELFRRVVRRPTRIAILGVCLLAAPYVANGLVRALHGDRLGAVPAFLMIFILIRTFQRYKNPDPPPPEESKAER